MKPIVILRDTLILMAFFAVLVGFMVAAGDAIPQGYATGVTMP